MLQIRLGPNLRVPRSSNFLQKYSSSIFLLSSRVNRGRIERAELTRRSERAKSQRLRLLIHLGTNRGKKQGRLFLHRSAFGVKVLNDFDGVTIARRTRFFFLATLQ